MSSFGYIARIVAMGAVVVAAASPSVAREAWQPSIHAPTSSAIAQKRTTHTAKPAKLAGVRMRVQPASIHMVRESTSREKEHHLILQVNTNDAAAMNLALNNAMNVTQYYKQLREKVKIEVITFGPGLNMLREDTSPVKARIETMALGTPEVSFKACGNTQENMRKAENKDIPIIPQAQVVKSGVVRVMQLQEQGWTYVKP